MSKNKYDAIVIGSGPNGLAAAITLARAGRSVVVFEAKETIGGGMRSAELTLPGFVHDVCSAIHPLGIGSPFFRTLPLFEHGLEWIQPPSPLAHPFDDGSVAILDRSIQDTSKTLGVDASAYKNVMEPLVRNWDLLVDDLLAPFHLPRHPLTMLRFALLATRSASGLARSLFKGSHAQAFFAGLAAHSILPLDRSMTAGFGLVLGALGHVTGWPLPFGGSQNIANALGDYFLSLGGEIITGVMVKSLEELPKARSYIFDVTPKQLVQIVGARFPLGYREKLKKYRYGPGVFKIDWALNHPIPWKAKECLQAGTVHLGGTLEEIENSEKQVWNGIHPEKPFVLLAQPSLFDPTRAPPGKHTAWAYCHVPNGSVFDMTERIEAQVERFAPGFRASILAKNTLSTMQLEQYNPNYIGGDINGGVQDIYQFFTRPTARITPYSTPLKNIYICSSSTPPGGGVHGMCGYHAASAVLKQDINS